MIDIFVGAASGSNVSNAEVTVKGNGFQTTIMVSAGTYGRAQVVPNTVGPVTNVELSVRSADKQVTVYADNIPLNGIINILGSDALRFDGQIYHQNTSGVPKTAPVCSLRCEPTDTARNGPGCRECNVGGLVFKVCC
jgi:hypothetical protein